MATQKKTRPDAVLKNLPRDKQQEIMDYLVGTPTSKPHSCKATAAWLAADGIQISRTVVGLFRAWFDLRCELEATESTTLEILRTCKANGWIKTLKEEQAAGQIFFNRMALDRKEPKTWAMMQGVSLRQEHQDLEVRKFKLLQDRQAQARKIVNDTQMTPEQKEERIRQIMGLN